jgi:hypothetical protein
MFRGLEQYKQDAGFAKEVKGFLAPVSQALQQHGVAPQQFLGNLVNAHLALSSSQLSAEQKTQFATNLLAQYGIELTPKDPDAGGYVDPQVKSLQDKIASLESRLTGADQKAANEAREKIQADLNAFADDPAHPYFDEVADDIAALIRGSGGKMTLQDAYDRAVWANPTTRAKETARAQAEAVEKAKKEDAERAAAARRATGGRVKTSGHQGGGTATTGSMEDTMAETLASIRKKDGR